MALLGDIRKRSGLLIVIIGFALLAFLVGDIFGRGDLFGNPNELGSVAGTPISAQDYNVTYNRLSQMPQLQQAGENVVSEMAWNQLIEERIVADKMAELGLIVSEEQYLEQAGRFYQSVNPE
ncbi:MAG: SurA N-terminal domain-containing protein, partial [Weeksellaceae bacterium]